MNFKVMPIKQLTLLLVFLITCYPVFSSASAKDLKPTDTNVYFYTEVSRPYYWFDNNNQPQGATLDLAVALMANTELQGVVEHVPWARAYLEAKNKPNVVLLTALRTPEREKQLQWLGTVHTAEAHLLSLKTNSNIQISKLEDAKKYMVATIRGYGSAEFLIKNGFVEGENLLLLSNQTQLWSMLHKGRVDLVLDNLTTANFDILSAGLNNEDVHSLLNIQELNMNLALATGHLTDKNTTELLRIGLQQLKSNGTYHQIMKKWGLVD